MKINNLNRITNLFNAVNNTYHMAETRKSIINSVFSEEMKEKALKEDIKRKKLTIGFGIGLFLFCIFFAVISCFLLMEDDSGIGLLISMGIFVLLLIIAIVIFILVIKYSTKEYQKACNYIKCGFDKLTEEEIKKRIPDEEALKIIKVYKRHRHIWAIIGVSILLFAAFAFSNIKLINFEEGISIFWIIAFIIMFAPYMLKMNAIDEAILELQKGYIGNAKCMHCNENIIFLKSDIKNDILNCPICQNNIPLNKDCFVKKPSFFTSKGMIIYTVIILIVVTLMGSFLDFRTDEEKRWNNFWTSYHESIDNIKDWREKTDKINQNLEDLNNDDSKIYEDALDDVKDATSNIYDILSDLKDTEEN